MRLGAAVTIVLLAAGCKQLDDTGKCQCGTPETPSKLSCDKRGYCEGSFELVGSSDLNARGMNSAIAIAGNYAYIGSRSDGPLHQDAGVVIVDISDPTAPKMVGNLGPDEQLMGLSARELRAVPDLHLLYVLNLYCGAASGDCSNDLNLYPTTGGIQESENLKIFDITDPIHPKLLSLYDFHAYPGTIPYAPPHEFFLWRDPNNPSRILLYVSRIYGPPSLEVVDATNPSAPTQLTTWDAINDAQLDDSRIQDESLHSMAVSDDGRVVYVAHHGVGFFMLSADELVDQVPGGKLQILTPLSARVDYSPPYDNQCHSAVKVPGRNVVLLTDEVYPLDNGSQGCPWGWAWMVDITDPKAPTFFETSDPRTGAVTINGQMRLPWNEKDSCPAEGLQHQITYTAHNPTVTHDLAIITWYGGGVQAFDISDPANPVQVGAFYPDALPHVAAEDPVVAGTPTEMWSYPIFRDGLIYTVDIRNGLYVLRYTGPHADEISGVPFLEGNSNLK